MRNLIVSLLVLAACGGASSGQVSSAKTAQYTGDKLQIFHAVQQAVQEKYPIARADENTLILETIGRWYTHEGLSASERLEDIRDVPDKSIHIAFIVAVLPSGSNYTVDVKPKWYRYSAGSPQPSPMKEDDISVEGFAHEKVDALAVTIHDALKSFEVKSVPAVVPAGSGAPAPAAPPAGSAAAPPAGSAAAPPAQ